MEELQNAIEDAVYLSAVSETLPTPSEKWIAPTPVQLEEFVANLKVSDPACFTLGRLCEKILGFFMFGKFCRKRSVKYAIMYSFLVDIIRFKRQRGRAKRRQYAREIIEKYLIPGGGSGGDHTVPDWNAVPDESDLARTQSVGVTPGPGDFVSIDEPVVPEGTASISPQYCCLMVGGPGIDRILEAYKTLLAAAIKKAAGGSDHKRKDDASSNGTTAAEQFTFHSTTSIHLNGDDTSAATEPSPSPSPSDVQNGQTLSTPKAGNTDDSGKPKPPAPTLRSPTIMSALNLDEDADVLLALKSPDSARAGAFFVQGSEHSDNLYVNSKAFDLTEAWVFATLEKDLLEEYLQSKYHADYIKYYCLQFQPLGENSFTVFRVLGRGGFGAVYGCKRATSGKLYAMKVMSRARIKSQHSEDLCWNERRLLEQVSSPFVVSLKYSFASPTNLVLVLDLMTGGDLSFHLSQMGRFTYDMARYYVARTVLAIDHLHNQGIVYRDLKPENMLLGEDGRCRISDMGLACKVHPNLTGSCGTRGYWAPEMKKRDENGDRIPYGVTVDWFSLGAVVYEFLLGVGPFVTERAKQWNKDKISEVGKRVDAAMQEMVPDWVGLDYKAKDLCQKLLNKNPLERLGAKGGTEIIQHPWFGSFDWDKLAQDQMKPPFVPKKNINAAPQASIGSFNDKVGKESLSKEDMDTFIGWDYTSETSFHSEVVDFLRHGTHDDFAKQSRSAGSTCCTIA